MVLNNRGTPRAKFILWLALMWDRVAKKDRLLLQFGISVDPLCRSCESHDHILFECFTIQPAWQTLLIWFGCSFSNSSWQANIMKLCRQSKGRNPRCIVLKVLCTEVIYALWMECNRWIFQEKSLRLELYVAYGYTEISWAMTNG